MPRLDGEPEYRRRRREKAERDEKAARHKRHEAQWKDYAEEAFATVIRHMEEGFRRANDEETPHKRSERRWHKAEVWGLWAAALVGLIAITVASFDSHEQRDAMLGQLNEMKQQRLLTMAQTRANLRRDVVLHPRNEEGRLLGQFGGKLATWDVNPTWQNIGSSDARNFRSWWTLTVVPMPTPQSDGRAFVDCPLPNSAERINPTIITPGTSRMMFAKPLSLADATAAHDGKALILISVSAEYEDIFYPETPRHHANWCVITLPNDVPGGEFSFPTVRDQAD